MKFGMRELMFFFVLLAVPVASFMYVFKPRNAEIAAADQEIQGKRAKLEQLQLMTATIDDLGAAIEEGRRTVQTIEAKLPNEQGVEVILEQVWQLAKNNHLIVKSVKSEKSVPAALYMELPLKVWMEGDFDGFYQFMLELENLPRITRIHEMKLERLNSGGSSKSESAPPGTLKAEFILSIYFQPQQSSQIAQG